MPQENHSIILFDGVCNFCNYWVNFIIDRDKENRFKFAALQSEKGRELLEEYSLPTNDFDSFILVSNKKIYKKSLAAFEIAKNINGWPKILLLFRFLPSDFSDWVYSMVANNRYKFFGKKDSCRIPTEEEKTKFL
ncbi:MAG: thiol-disulfide oxidoreductase DCC family protein [Ignavibacteriaceae bacterium]